jgi:hypothetical protein
VSYTIFEGTSEIQRLIVSRAISGMHIQKIGASGLVDHDERRISGLLWNGSTRC